MGASTGNVLRMVIGKRAILVAMAIMAGLAGAWALTRYAQSLLYGITAQDTPTFALTPLAGFVLIAALEPAWRASQVDPMSALREE